MSTTPITITFAVDLSTIPNLFKGFIMSAITDQLKASNAALIAKFEEYEGKVDNLVVVLSATRDTVTALQAQVAAGQVATVDDLQSVIDAQTAAIATVGTKEVAVDAAAADPATP